LWHLLYAIQKYVYIKKSAVWLCGWSCVGWLAVEMIYWIMLTRLGLACYEYWKFDIREYWNNNINVQLHNIYYINTSGKSVICNNSYPTRSIILTKVTQSVIMVDNIVIQAIICSIARIMSYESWHTSDLAY
jgi:hypothetical protein